MTISELSKLPRLELNRKLGAMAAIPGTNGRILTAAQWRIIDLEYELLVLKDELKFFKENFEGSFNPGEDIFDGEFTEVRGE